MLKLQSRKETIRSHEQNLRKKKQTNKTTSNPQKPKLQNKHIKQANRVTTNQTKTNLTSTKRNESRTKATPVTRCFHHHSSYRVHEIFKKPKVTQLALGFVIVSRLLS